MTADSFAECAHGVRRPPFLIRILVSAKLPQATALLASAHAFPQRRMHQAPAGVIAISGKLWTHSLRQLGGCRYGVISHPTSTHECMIYPSVVSHNFHAAMHGIHTMPNTLP